MTFCFRMDLLQPNFQQILLYSLSGHGGSMYPKFTRCHRWFVSNCATICRGDSVCESKFFVNTERIMMKSHESAESGNRRTIFTIGNLQTGSGVLHCSDGSGFMVLFTRNIKDLVECHFQISGCVGQSEKFIDFSASLQKLIYLSFLIFLLFEMEKFVIIRRCCFTELVSRFALVELNPQNWLNCSEEISCPDLSFCDVQA
ncbi:hypothetical protein T02_10036 [Trichinella nativa]|uniref:Uncharacterized protein n=1 Tax=Trichinella nativa TaxID=6335 RepID=A0A0V1LFR8_9BILA|nr:hypothetical protein T02_10036 [Trichinella nativa]